MAKFGKGKKEGKQDAEAKLLMILAALILGAGCIVFAVLCLSYFTYGFIARRLLLLIVLSYLLTIGYTFSTIVFIAKEKKTAYRLLFSGYALILFFLVLLYVAQKTGFFALFQDVAAYKEYLASAGIWMPLVYIALQYLQVVVLPIPGIVSTLAGVALFGAFRAMIYSLIGILLGSFTGFFIGRKLGYKAVVWLVGRENLDKWLKKMKGKDNFILTAMFVLPLFPDDILCFVAGLTSMSRQYFIVMIIVARSIGIAATCYSIDFIPFNTWWGVLLWIVIIVGIVAAFVWLYKYTDDINEWMKRKFRIKKQDGHKREKK